MKAIYDWICQNVTYDYEGLGNKDDLLKYTAYGALIDKNAVCQGYSVLLYRLLLELGIDNRIITSENHAWNIIKLGNVYYNADPTWDAPYAAEGMEYVYFLKSMEGFTGHERSEEYSHVDFVTKYPMSETDYGSSENPLPVPDKPYKIVNVVSGPHVYWTAIPGVEKYGVWRSSDGADGTYQWLGNPTVPHFTDVNVESGKTYHYKITAMVEGKHSAMSESIGIVYVDTPDIIQRTNRRHLSGMG